MMKTLINYKEDKENALVEYKNEVEKTLEAQNKANSEKDIALKKQAEAEKETE